MLAHGGGCAPAVVLCDVENRPSQVANVHRIGLGAGIVFVENLTGLHQVPATGAWLVFLPLKLVGGSGAPGRAVALVPREGVGGG